MPNIYVLLLAYLAVISILAILITRYDKASAQRGRRRVREQTLLIIALLGGSAAMFLTMQSIRHKTKQAKFMAGLPLIIALQIAIGVLIWRLF